MSDNHSDQSSESTDKLDQQRLLELLNRLHALRDQGHEDCLENLLAELDEAEKTIYGRSLTKHFGETVQVTMLSDAPMGTDTSNEIAESPTVDLPTIDLPHDYTPSNYETTDLGTLASDVVPSRPSLPARSSSRKPARSRSRSRDDDFELALPERIGKFRIKKELGRGAFGVVYLGFDEELQRNVAVKVSLVSDPKLQERLRVEASKLAQAESPGIVPVYHIGRTDEGKVYIVQKYIEGSTLRDVLRDHPLSPLVAVAMMREIALGLGPAHAIDILHRDLKPDNILIDPSGKAWIADFGLAISEDEQIDHKRELAGTPPYMSPEQIKGRIDFLDPRSDIWALGVMFYELLTGKLPFNGKDRKAITEQICELDPRPLHQRAPGFLSESMNEVFLRCCAKKPSDRYTTVVEFVAALDQLAEEGLSDHNIHGQRTLAIGDLPTDLGLRSLAGSFESTRRASTRSFGHGQSTTATARASVSGAESGSRRIPTWGLAAAALGLTLVGIVGYRLLTDFYVSPDSANSLQGSFSPDGSPLTDGGLSSDSSAAAALANKKRIGDGSKEKPWIVAPGQLGTHATIAAAVAEASPGDTVRLMDGLYRESVLISKPLTIEGQAPKAGVYPCVIENDEQSPLTIDCGDGEVKIRSLMISGKGHRLTKEFNPIEVLGGTLRLETCALETRSQNCLKVRGDAKLFVLACKFLDSSDFAISAKDFSVISVRGSDFLTDGIEVTGGSGTVESCKFFGDAGIYVANNLQAVEASNCLFEGNAEHSLLAIDGGNLKIANATIRGSKTAVGVTDKPMINDVAGRPGVVSLTQTKLEQCEVGFQVDGGTLMASDECFIDGGLIAVGISSGKVELNGVSISRPKDKAILLYQGGTATLKQCDISGCDQTAIKITHGSLTFSGGSIEDFKLYGVMMGEQNATQPKEMQVTLEDLTVKTAQSKVAGVVAFSGSLALRSVILDGAGYGLYVDGQEFDGLAEDEPSVEVRADATRFKNQTGFGVVALGRTRLTMDEATNTSLNASQGLKASPPAEVVVDERPN